MELSPEDRQRIEKEEDAKTPYVLPFIRRDAQAELQDAKAQPSQGLSPAVKVLLMVVVSAPMVLLLIGIVVIHSDRVDYQNKPRGYTMGDIIVAESESVYDQLWRDPILDKTLPRLRQQLVGLYQTGKIFQFTKGTDVYILEHKAGMVKIYIPDGRHQGKTGWVPDRFVAFSISGSTPSRAESIPVVYIRDSQRVPIAVDEIAYKELDQTLGGRGSLASLLQAEKIFRVDNNTKVEILEDRFSKMFVRILEGEKQGREGWVNAGFVYR